MKQNSLGELKVPRLRQRIRRETETAILDAAERTLDEEGVQAARIETIAARAGVAVGTLYNYFSDRDALLTELLIVRKSELLAAMDAAATRLQGQPWPVQFQGFVGALLDHMECHRRFFSVLFQGELLPKRSLKVDDPGHPRGTMKEMHARIETVMRAGVRCRAVRGDDIALFPAMLLGLIRGVVVREFTLGDARPLPELREPIVTMFLRGAGARSR